MYLETTVNFGSLQMEIKYDAYWQVDGRIKRITHGIITDADLQEIIERKEREECGGLDDMEFESSSVESIQP